MVTMKKKMISDKKQASCQSSGQFSQGPCPVKEALRFLSGAWTLEIYWALKSGPLRFGQIKRQLGSVSAKVLTHRLRDLEDLGVLEREVKETYPPQVEYSLTSLGLKFGPILETIASVGQGLLRKSKKTAAQQKS